MNEVQIELIKNIGCFDFQATNWVSLFTSMAGKCQGCSKARVTPYIHAMVYHIPYFMKENNGIKKFTGQGNNINFHVCNIFVVDCNFSL